jgi:peptidylglycine monooxygenase
MAVRNSGLPSSGHPCGSGNAVIYAWAQDAPGKILQAKGWNTRIRNGSAMKQLRSVPALTLPEGVGFRVGGDSGIDWLVLQVHYAVVNHIPPTGDVSGVSLRYTNVKQPRSAGVLFLGTNGRIPSKATTKMEAACQIYEDVRSREEMFVLADVLHGQILYFQKVVHPFAFRVHTHRLGRVVSGWRVKDRQEWELIGKENPQMPQMFYPGVAVLLV